MTNIIEKTDDETKIESQSNETETNEIETNEAETEEIKESADEIVSSEINENPTVDEESPDDKEDDSEVIPPGVQLQHNTPNPSTEFVPPGMRLRQLREKHNVSVKHVADRLFLDVGVIEKLENDDYEHLPPPIFVRGYMRNYAKLFDIKPESITDDFDPDRKQPKLRPQMQRKEQASRQDPLHIIGTVAIVIISLVLVAIWYSSPESTPSIELLPDSQINGQPILPPDSPNVEEPPESGEGTNIPTEQPTDGEPASGETSEPVVETPAPADNDKTLKIHFKADAWIRVTDKTNNSLYQGTGKKGTELSRDGTPPFSLRVGNVDGVDIEYKGETKDIKSYPKKRNLFIIGSDSQ
ncbi:DUF4115 domain-containing protein [Candidatus Halobeggiatoa sp. HSG11]|nr:DUF4115 domain-containing protein [Candidatus Halobeggiatoa sp. HSG11]